MTPPDGFAVLDTTTGPDTLAQIQNTLDQVWASAEVPERVQMHMDLAASEVGANIVEHAGDGTAVHLRMEVHLLPDAVRTVFTDQGHPAPVDLSQVQMPDEMAERGRGLAIAVRVLDELSYRRDHEGNHWTLVRRLQD
ncbi:ATP-binding protein [Mycobacterium sp. ACS4331]|uniref:ATP-binding protein n=1 Tax=Mycobacterium sp. ACS4331 TaxID=1834121 RepID=UPI0007FBA107|nr:ATP-binding protein [Mycobacterium sp. ACS4331]OBF09713.1 anti-sigma regulatory factor [Mycobacterium sp. ACS4331]